jgi:hypothetical protein
MVLRGGASQYPGGSGDGSNDRMHREYRVDGNGNVTLNADQFDAAVGIRIVAIPEPGTISFMSISTIGLFIARSVRRKRSIGRAIMPVAREPLCDRFGELPDTADVYAQAHESEFFALLQVRAVQLKGAFVRTFGSLDKRFWNFMVVRHERTVVRRAVVRANLKKKSLNALDTFLARIMK